MYKTTVSSFPLLFQDDNDEIYNIDLGFFTNSIDINTNIYPNKGTGANIAIVFK